MESKPNMAIPSRRWAGYGIAFSGLLLLLDANSFPQILTPDSYAPVNRPPSLPLSAVNELILGYLLIILAVILLITPTLATIVGSYVPDASMNLGEDLAYRSIEFRRRQRLPLRRKFSLLPNRELAGGAIFLLVVPAFVMVIPAPSHGIYVHLVSQVLVGLDENCMKGPIILSIKQRDTEAHLFLNGKEVDMEGLDRRLQSELAWRANREVFVDADQSLDFGVPALMFDKLNAINTTPVLLTPALRKQLAKACPSF